MLADYALDNDLLEEKSWKWAKQFLRTPVKAINHRTLHCVEEVQVTLTP